jgi:hypothetical protein
MEELRCKCPISWKWCFKGDLLISFAKIPMSFGGLKLYNELLEGANSII